MYVQETYFRSAAVLKNQGYCFISQAIIQLLLYKFNPTIKYFAYLWVQLKESLAVDCFSCLFKVTRYTCLCFIY